MHFPFPLILSAMLLAAPGAPIAEEAVEADEAAKVVEVAEASVPVTPGPVTPDPEAASMTGDAFETGDIGETLYTEGVDPAGRHDDSGGITIYETPLVDAPPLPDRVPVPAPQTAMRGDPLMDGNTLYGGPSIDLLSGAPPTMHDGDGLPHPIAPAPVYDPVVSYEAAPAPAPAPAYDPPIAPAPIAYDVEMVEPVMAVAPPALMPELVVEMPVMAPPVMAAPVMVEPVMPPPVITGPVLAAPVIYDPVPAEIMAYEPAPMVYDPAPVIYDAVPVAYEPAPARKPGAAELTRRSGAGPEMAMRSYGRSIIDPGGEGVASQHAVVNVSKAAVVKLPADAKEVVVSDPTVVNAILRTARQTVLIGLKVGQTNAFFFDDEGGQILNLEIRVEPDLRPLEATLRETFPGNNLTVEALLGEVILRGSAGSPAEAQRIVAIVRRYIGASRASTGVDGDVDAIEVVNRLTVAGEDQVLLKVRIAEMKRSIVKQFGVDWSVTGDIIGNLAAGANGLTSSSSFGVNGALLGGLTGNLFAGGDGGGLNTLIKAFERHGLVRILAEPTLTAVTGETASFLAGGQFPFPVSVENGQVGFEFRDFGVALEFAPVVLDGGRISLRIATEVSELTSEGSLSTTGGITIPGIAVRRANTVVELPSGGTMAMAGLIQQKDSADHAGLPGLKNLPVLGQLFSSSDFKRSETELVILVTPYVANHGQENDFQLPTEGVPPPSDSEFYLLGRLHAVYGDGGEGDYASARNALHAPLGFILD